MRVTPVLSGRHGTARFSFEIQYHELCALSDLKVALDAPSNKSVVDLLNLHHETTSTLRGMLNTFDQLAKAQQAMATIDTEKKQQFDEIPEWYKKKEQR